MQIFLRDTPKRINFYRIEEERAGSLRKLKGVLNRNLLLQTRGVGVDV